MCMMNKNSLLLSIAATALLWSLFLSGLAHAVQTESRQDIPNLIVAESTRTANAQTAQLSNTPNPCSLGGKGRTRAACGKYSRPASGVRTTVWSPYINAIFTVMLTVILCTLIFLAAFSLALIVLAALSRRIPHRPLERASINLAWCGQGRRAS
jgi:hypothetical protein